MIDDKPAGGARPDWGTPGVDTGRDRGGPVSNNPAGGEVPLDRYGRKEFSKLELDPKPHEPKVRAWWDPRKD